MVDKEQLLIKVASYDKTARLLAGVYLMQKQAKEQKEAASKKAFVQSLLAKQLSK